MAEDSPPLIPLLKLKNPEQILEKSINSVHFLRFIKKAKTQTLRELFPNLEYQQELVKIFNSKNYSHTVEDENNSENSVNNINLNTHLPTNKISMQDFRQICEEKLNIENVHNETLELIFYIFDIPLTETTELDFLLFSRLFYLIYKKKTNEEDFKEESSMENGTINSENVSDYSLNSLHDKNKYNKENVIMNYDEMESGNAGVDKEEYEESEYGINDNDDDLEDEY